MEARQADIDGLIGDAAIGWEVERMAVVDRNVLRLAVAELLDYPDVPTPVILNEAVELASAYSTDDSGRFVNGVLATLAERVRAAGRRADRPSCRPAVVPGCVPGLARRTGRGYTRRLTVKRVP